LKHKVVCVQPIHPEGMKILRSREDLEIIVPESPEPQYWEQHLADVEAIVVRITRIERWMIEKAPRLKLISRHGVGVDNIDLAAAAARGVPVGNTPGVLTDATADLAFALLLAAARRLLGRAAS